MTKNPLRNLSTKDGLDAPSLLRTLIDSLPDHVYVKDAEGRYVLSNVAHVRALGASSLEEVAGKSDFDFYPQELAERYRADEQEIISSGRPVIDKEEPNVDEEGNERWHSITKVPLRNGSGEIVGIVGVTQDITERKEAEEALKETEERFRTAFEDAPIGVALVGLDRSHLRVNHAFCEMLGYSEGELLEKAHPEIIHPDDLEISAKRLRQTLEGGPESYILERRYIHADGHTVWNLSSVSLVRDSQGEPSHFVCVHQDITERKWAEEKVRESEERFRALVQNASDVITILETDGTVRYKSPSVERILGYHEEEMLGTKVFDYVHPEDVENVRRTFAATVESPGVQPPVQFRFRHADDSWRHVEAIRNNLLDDPNVQGIVVNTRDITERKEAEEKLRKSEARLTEAQRIAHLGNWEWDVKTGEVYWSDEVFRIYGYTPGEFVPTLDKLMEAVHPDDRELVRKKIDDTLYEGKPYDFEHRIVRPDGEERVVHRQAEVYFDEEGEPLRMIGTIHDITEQKEAEEALRESEERYRTVVEQSVEGIWLFDPDTKQVLESNAAFQEILGYTAEELQEMTNYDFVAHSREDIDSAVQQVVQERRGYFGERKYRRKDGTVLDVEVSGTVIPYKGKEVLCGVARDLTERKRAEEKLRESEERFRSAFEDAPIGVALVDLDGRRFRANRALCEMLGYSEEELLDKEYLEDIHPDDQEISSKHLRRTLEGGPESYTLERRYIHADGHTVWNLTSVSLIQDSQGNPSHLVCLHQDITERKEVERKLRKSEASLAEAQRIAHLGNWELDAKTGEMSWSDEVFRIYGYQPKEFVPTYDKLLEGAHPDDRELSRKHIDGALYEGEPYDFEHRIVRSDGEERVVRCQAEVVFDEEGEPLRMIGTIHDITEQKEAEKALRESELLLRTVIGNVPIILFALDNKGVITLSEGKGLETLGFKPNEMIGQSVFDVYRDRPQFLEDARRVLDGEEITTTIELNGRMLEVRSSSPRDETGEVSGVIGVAIDVTERRQAEERLREANRRLEELAVLRADFTAMVAHEIDTPLAVIQGYTDMLAAGKLGPAEQSQALAKIQAETDMLKALVADARTAAAIEREDFTVEPQQIPVGTLLDDAARFAATLPGNHPLAIEKATDEQVWADPPRIGQVLRNLLSNAAKYSPEGAPIELRAKPGETSGHVWIEVADRGQGIHPDDVARIFEKFGRGRDRYGRKMAGVGLGLYISQRILQAHGGDLTLDSAPGGGSVFGFELEVVR